MYLQEAIKQTGLVHIKDSNTYIRWDVLNIDRHGNGTDYLVYYYKGMDIPTHYKISHKEMMRDDYESYSIS